MCDAVPSRAYGCILPALRVREPRRAAGFQGAQRRHPRVGVAALHLHAGRCHCQQVFDYFLLVVDVPGDGDPEDAVAPAGTTEEVRVLFLETHLPWLLLKRGPPGLHGETLAEEREVLHGGRLFVDLDVLLSLENGKRQRTQRGDTVHNASGNQECFPHILKIGLVLFGQIGASLQSFLMLRRHHQNVRGIQLVVPPSHRAHGKCHEDRPIQGKLLEAEVQHDPDAAGRDKLAAQVGAQGVQLVAALLVPHLGEGSVQQGFLDHSGVDWRSKRQDEHPRGHEEHHCEQHQVHEAPNKPRLRHTGAVGQCVEAFLALRALLSFACTSGATGHATDRAETRRLVGHTQRLIGSMVAVVLRDALPMTNLVLVVPHERARLRAHRRAPLGCREGLEARRAVIRHRSVVIFHDVSAAEPSGSERVMAFELWLHKETPNFLDNHAVAAW
mmetsp:Transcript_45247/g.145007  ORF Transcript_45247/g.145007 Transcript_45247/m.145007 type:complete len:443 (-) Transcript_45247:200-1528(-)